MKSFFNILLSPLYLLYIGFMYIRNILFDTKLLPSKKLDCTVISIGNLSFGGTGKTPFTIALAEKLKSKYRVAILSRGYKRNSRGTVLATEGKEVPTDWKVVGDEPYLISQKLTNIPVVVDEDRYRGGKYLVENFNPDIILLDDGFQHRKLHRDIDIVLFDASNQHSPNHWREPFSSAKRANMFVLTKSDDNETLAIWKKRLSVFKKPIFRSNAKPDGNLIGLKGKELDIDQLRGKSVLTFSGIAKHDSFNNTIQQIGCKIVESISFKDHHHYIASDIDLLEKIYADLRPDYLLTTEKDIFKLPATNMPIYALAIEMELPKYLINNIEKSIRMLD